MAKTASVLTKVAAYGAVLAVGGAWYFTSRIQANFRRQEYYKKSLSLLESYPPACRILGEPVRALNVKLDQYSKTKVDGYNASLTIPVQGIRKKGLLYCEASREKLEDPWTVDKLDLEVRKQRWTFYIDPKSVNKVTAYKQEEFTDSDSSSDEITIAPSASESFDTKTGIKQDGQTLPQFEYLNVKGK